ncbi:MAG: alpha/beta hydrolase [Planctomycetota bacterium]|jgi:phospholipase/carboxylesterase
MSTLRPLLLTLLFLLLALGAAPGQEAAAPAAEEKLDIMKVTPEELRGEDVDELVSRAHQAYREERYEDSARGFVAALRRNPGDSSSLYNLACCYGLLGAGAQAARFLDAAWEAGFRDLGHIRRDPDFARVRKEPGFRSLMERLSADEVRRAREAGRLIPVGSPVLATVRVIEPKGERPPWQRLPLVIGLHGLGGSGESFAALFSRRGIEVPFLYCVPQAPYAYSPGRRIGYSWSLRGPRISPAHSLGSHRLSVRYVLDVLEAVKREYPVDERNVFLMGFSQGAAMAFSVGLRHPDLFRGVIPVGGWVDPGEHRPAALGPAAKHGLFFVCHSPEDRLVTFDSCETAIRLLEAHSIPHRILRYEGGHSMPKELVEKIVAWIGNPEADRKSEPTKSD